MFVRRIGIIPILPPLMLGSKSGSRIMPPRESPTRISIWRKKSRTSCFGSPERKAALWKARLRISVLRTSTIRKAKHRWRAPPQSHLGDVLKIVGIEGRGEAQGQARRAALPTPVPAHVLERERSPPNSDAMRGVATMPTTDILARR